MMNVREVKLCLLGDSNVGKSSLVHQFVYETFQPAIEMTMGAAFWTKCVMVDDCVCKFQIWDTAGQEKYKSLAPMYYRGAAAAIIVYDITKEQSFAAVKSWIQELMVHADSTITMCVTGNKLDLEDDRTVSSLEAKSYAERMGALYIETSAKTAFNVVNMFQLIAKKVSSLEQWNDEGNNNNNNNINYRSSYLPIPLKKDYKYNKTSQCCK